MMQMIGKLSCIGIILTFIGCATALSDQASRVRIINAEEAKAYEYIGIVEGTSGFAGLARNIGYQNALNEVLEKAAAKGAEFIVLDPKSKPAYWTTNQLIKAEAFKSKS